MGILTDVKKYLGISEDDNYFDSQIIMCINSAFATLTQIGAGPKEGFTISDDSREWSEFESDFASSWIQMNVSANVKRMFDPPTNGSVMEALNDVISETEWRAYIDADGKTV